MRLDPALQSGWGWDGYNSPVPVYPRRYCGSFDVETCLSPAGRVVPPPGGTGGPRKGAFAVCGLPPPLLPPPPRHCPEPPYDVTAVCCTVVSTARPASDRTNTRI